MSIVGVVEKGLGSKHHALDRLAVISNSIPILIGCTTARDRGTCDNRPNFRRDVLEVTVLDR